MVKNLKEFSGLSKASLVVLAFIIIFAIYAIVADPWNLSSAPYGAGDYYYTDVEGFDFSINIGTKHPVVFFVLFFGWAFGCWYFVKWLEENK
ncbi:MAG: hypothetical protein ACOWWO_10875 [Peptococcaceae bacterium]